MQLLWVNDMSVTNYKYRVVSVIKYLRVNICASECVNLCKQKCKYVWAWVYMQLCWVYSECKCVWVKVLVCERVTIQLCASDYESV